MIKLPVCQEKEMQILPKSPNCLFIMGNCDCYINITFTRVISDEYKHQQTQNKSVSTEVQVYGTDLRFC